MRILHTSDWHLGRSLDQVGRIKEQKEFVDFLVKTAEEQMIDLVLIAGDIYDTFNPSAAAEELFYDAIERLNDWGRRAVVIIAGNHDSPERLCAASPLAYKSGIIILGYPGSDAGCAGTSGEIRVIASGNGWLEIETPKCEHHAVILTLPYPSESRLEEVLSINADEGILQKAYSEKIGSLLASGSIHFRDDTVNLIAAHIFVLGGKESDSERTLLQIGGALTVDPGMLPAKANYAALGHLHRPQQIRNSPCPAFYSGSPLAYSFSEAEHVKAVYVVEAEPGGETLVTPIYLNCGKPLKKWIAENGYGQALKWCEDGRDLDAWVDLEIATDRILTTEELKKLRSLHPGILNIRPHLLHDANEIQDFHNRENKRIDELFKDYYKTRTGSDIPEELIEAFIDIAGSKYGEVESGETEAS